MEITAKELAVILGARLEGNPNQKVNKIAKIEEADADSLCFIANPKYEHYGQTAKAGVLICREGLDLNPDVKATLRVADPYSAFQQLLSLYNSMNGKEAANGIDQHTHIGKNTTYGADFYLGAFSYLGNNVKIGNSVKIYPNCFIGDNVEIGDNNIINAGVAIYHDCKVGHNNIIHAGVVIGADGFGFAPQPDGSFQKIPQTGNVVICNNTEIGANTCIDRATIGSTLIRDGVKLDNLIQVGHNVELGENTVIAAQTGISGSAKLGKNILIGGQAGITGHLSIADGTKIQAKAAVIKDVADGTKGLSGIPAIDAREHYRQIAALRQLPELLKRVDQLEKKLKEKG